MKHKLFIVVVSLLCTISAYSEITDDWGDVIYNLHDNTQTAEVVGYLEEQETAGNVTLLELGNYIIQEVPRRLLEEGTKIQTPRVTPSTAVEAEWQNWKLK